MQTVRAIRFWKLSFSTRLQLASGLVLIAKGRKGVDNWIIKSVKGEKRSVRVRFFCWCIELYQLLL